MSIEAIVRAAREIGRHLSSTADASTTDMVAESCEMLGLATGADIVAMRSIDTKSQAHFVAGWATTAILDGTQPVLTMRDDVDFSEAILAKSLADMPTVVRPGADLDRWRDASPLSAQSLFCPIRSDRRTFGFLCLIGRPGLQWDQGVIDAVLLAASVVGQYQLRVWSDAEHQRRLDLANLIWRFSHGLADLNPEQQVAAIAAALGDVGHALDATLISLWELDHEKQLGRRLARWHVNNEAPLAGPVVELADSPLHDSDLREPRVISNPDWKQTLVVAPGFLGMKPTLCLAAARPVAHQWSDWECGELSSFADLVARLREKASTDARLAATFNEAPNGIALCSTNGELVDCNRAYLDFLGVDERSDLDAGPQASIAMEFVPAHAVGAVKGDRWDRLDGLELPYRRRDGSLVWGRASTVRIGDEPERLWLLHVVDVTAQREALETIRQRAITDPLTATANRHAITDTLTTLLRNADEPASSDGADASACAVVLLDLDGFKAVNDEYGHAAGDHVLMAVVRRLQTLSRPNDLIGRYGGDEFIVVLDGPIGDSEATLQARRLRTCFAAPFEVGERYVFVGASLGLARALSGDTPDELLARADAAMYREKTGFAHRHAPLLDLTASSRTLDLRAAGIDSPATRRQDGASGKLLRNALSAGEIVFWGQPIWHAPSGMPLGVELLARWLHPDGTVDLPDSFVSVAERTGLVVELGRQALATAADTLVRWSSDPDLVRLGVNVNVSPQHLMHGLIGEVGQLMPELPPDAQLGLEFVETALAAGAREHFGPLEELRDSGVRVLIDDFGVGHSSLSRLQQFPASNLKLDRSFIADIVADEGRHRFFRAISRLLGAAGYPVTAEGVETAEQLALVRSSSVQALQGYYLARPAPLEEIEEFVRPFIRDPSARFAAEATL